jgi:hypothetical protein
MSAPPLSLFFFYFLWMEGGERGEPWQEYQPSELEPNPKEVHSLWCIPSGHDFLKHFQPTRELVKLKHGSKDSLLIIFVRNIACLKEDPNCPLV